MTKEQARKKWIAALRSGKYQQGHVVLHKNNAFCCLGVACDLFKDELDLEVEEFHNNTFTYDACTGIAPDKIVELLGLIDSSGISKKRKISLVELNDINEFSFNQIADALETGEYWND